MQQKLQTILFFTFLICAQISITTSLKIKSKIQSKTTIKNATVDPAPTPAAPVPATNSTSPTLAHEEKEDKKADALEKKRHVDKHAHFGQASAEATHVASFKTSDTSDPNTDNHSNQFNVHHEVPKNLTALNDKVRSKLSKFHQRLDEINDLKKENEERKIIRQLPSKPDGVDAIGILNFKLRHISRQSQNFNIKSVDEFEYAFNKARYNKSHVATVNGKTYKIKQIGNNFWYGAIVGHGGIGIYAPNKTYVLIVTHNENMGLLNFARYFETLKHKFEGHRDELRAQFVKDKTRERTDALKARLKHDKHIYDREH